MAAALVKYLPEPGLEISFLFRSVRDDVRQTTRQKQTPYMYGQVSREKIFLNAVKPAALAVPKDDPSKVNRCDELAAAPEEAKRGLEKGIPMENIDAAAAQTACAEAVSRFPATDRLHYQMGRALFAAKDYPAAIESYKKAFELGNTRALYALGAMYDNGDGVPKDAARARFYYELAADLKFAPAIVSLAVQQERGLGVPADSAKAYSLYQKAAELGDARAISRMGALTENGLGVKKDARKARSLYEKSAALGDEEAMVHLARCYANGIGGRTDIKEAKSLLRKAAQAGSAAAKKILADVENVKRK
jgi:TPR repeat protein